MKPQTTIYYFTGTGNTLMTARDLADQLGDAKLVPMAGEMKKEQISADTEIVGFLFPVHVLGPAAIVLDFIERINLSSCKYIFAMPIVGGNHGISLHVIDKALQKKQTRLHGGFPLRMGSNTNLYMNIPGTSPILSPDEQKQIFAEARDNIKSIAEKVKKREEQPMEKIDWGKKLFLSYVYHIFFKSSRKFDKHFSCADTCTACKTCVSVCPADNIQLHAGKPQWMHNCRTCLSCFNNCPRQAIGHSYAKKSIMNMKYRHPEVKLSDLIAQKG